jgi:hypothetical protein
MSLLTKVWPKDYTKEWKSLSVEVDLLREMSLKVLH